MWQSSKLVALARLIAMYVVRA
eukprot:COSAG01_NODE_50562_length_362_cov_0.901141_2_plen_21_part_01